MAAAATHLWFAGRSLSAAGSNLCVAQLPAAERDAGAGGGPAIQHMQKALQQMNLLLHNVVSDITGVTGMKIIKAMLKGERDPQKLARHRDGRCHNSEQ